MNPRSSRGEVGMTPLTYQILVALAGSELHGYGIIKDLEDRNGAGSVPSTGALYLALQRMEEGGLVEESPKRPSVAEDDARRRYYRLTAVGRQAAVEETSRLANLVGVARDRRLITGRALSKVLPTEAGHGR
jgi:DNA-binding PadR family transcriptional regulator